ncbi:hypothetical protein CPI14_06650 [Moraxella catarrhalis]|nr:hypothetical protein [Moraxella catarrhalis]MPX87355.1 hypothetical protein [Moraxella catarrhalis]
MRFNVSNFTSALLYSLLGALVMLTMSALSVYLVGTIILASISFIICFGFAITAGFWRIR